MGGKNTVEAKLFKCVFQNCPGRFSTVTLISIRLANPVTHLGVRVRLVKYETDDS